MLVVMYLFAPVQTIFPELNINAVVLGTLILMITAANLYFMKQRIELNLSFKTVIKLCDQFNITLGLYSAFLACNAIFFKSSLQPRFTVETMFL